MGLIVSCHIHLPHADDERLGSLPPHSPSTPPTLTSPTSVRQLEALVRVHVMMVEVCGRGAPQHQTLCLSALGYCCHIWKVSLGEVPKRLCVAYCAMVIMSYKREDRFMLGW